MWYGETSLIIYRSLTKHQISNLRYNFIETYLRLFDLFMYYSIDI